MRPSRGLPARAFMARSFHAPAPVLPETDNVNLTERYETREPLAAARSYGQDVLVMIATGSDPDEIRLQARCAFRFAGRVA